MEESFEAGPHWRIVLQPKPEGVYIFVWDTKSSSFPEWDYLENTLEIAKECCLEDYGTPASSWRPFHGEGPMK
ncbi:hypothetical protein [Croceicoccus bisphenolivorans]|uniref:hypothetical protein n=1 Tax=Croceicoccus bisphenolivorans TaxID=1783232 RepID=UPI0008312778|nr:hypothetical protein [Croceicoccus bisphenolivorans]